MGGPHTRRAQSRLRNSSEDVQAPERTIQFRAGRQRANTWLHVRTRKVPITHSLSHGRRSWHVSFLAPFSAQFLIYFTTTGSFTKDDRGDYFPLNTCSIRDTPIHCPTRLTSQNEFPECDFTYQRILFSILFSCRTRPVPRRPTPPF